MACVPNQMQIKLFFPSSSFVALIDVLITQLAEICQMFMYYIFFFIQLSQNYKLFYPI